MFCRFVWFGVWYSGFGCDLLGFGLCDCSRCLARGGGLRGWCVWVFCFPGFVVICLCMLHAVWSRFCFDAGFVFLWLIWFCVFDFGFVLIGILDWWFGTDCLLYSGFVICLRVFVG